MITMGALRLIIFTNKGSFFGSSPEPLLGLFMHALSKGGAPVWGGAGW